MIKVHLDPEFIENVDTRNVEDQYRNWTVESIKYEMNSRAFPLHIAIENIQHDFNIGSIVRSANAFNVAGVHIIGKRHWNRRGAMSTEKYLNLFHHPDTQSFISWVHENKLRIVGIDNVEGSVKLAKYEFPKDAVLVFGQEGPGLSSEMQQHCEALIAVEQFGSTRSVNVGAAAGIIMYEWVRRDTLR
jgi:tRNA G18 (ribose-2'-O)-methylase SpoU